MDEAPKPLTEAEKQIRRLEALRARREEDSKQSAEKAFLPPRTVVEQTIEKLNAMKARSASPAAAKRAKIEGRQKSAKLSNLQLTVLEKLLAKDQRLRGSRVMRIALSRLLELDLSPEEVELETRIGELLRQMKPRP